MSARRASSFGTVRRLPSGRYQASYIWPPSSGQRHTANGTTFDTKTDARGWLARQHADRMRGVELAEPQRRADVPTFAEYAERWLDHRAAEGKARGTMRNYRTAVRSHLVPALGELRLTEIRPATVNDWFYSYGQRISATRAGVYRTLAGIMKAAVAEEIISRSPCAIKGGAVEPKRDHHVIVATPEQVRELADRMRPQWRMLVLLGAYCQLRFGELAELQRSDVDLDGGVIRIRRAMSRVDGKITSGPPKSQAGKRNVAVPPHLVGELRAHVAAYAQPGRHGFLFTTPRGAQLYSSVIYREWIAARESVELPELHFHDLRHAGITWLARLGATTKERMRRVGHADPRMVLRYEHADDERDAALAERLSAAVVVPIQREGVA